MSKNEFRVLEEKTEIDDLFEEKTHEKVANTLFEVITKNSNKGLTIGLEGGWGSGKSTVISILKKKLNTHNDTKFLYFDAWAHEGDPLRRVFLESIIEQIGIENDELTKISKEINEKQKSSKVTSKHTITGLGKIFTITTLFVPLGITFLSSLLRNNDFTLEVTLPIAWAFLIAFLFSVAPLTVLLIHGIRLFYKYKKISKVFKSEEWMFLQNEHGQTIYQEITDENERSTIEFEKYFNEILSVIFKNGTIERLLLIIDNLDRIDPDVTLTIWATLQTFLQERNPSGKIRPNYDKLWIIVPYDPAGLRKVWENHSENNSAKSFFEKCFQLRLSVPRLLMSGWEMFCKSCMDNSLLDWTDFEKNKAIDILRWTRKGVLDSPTPRQIKTFVNQLGILRNHSHEEIEIESLAYFVIEKYLKLKTNLEIQEALIKSELPEQRLISFLETNKVREDFSSMIFGVPPKKAIEILLETKIETALKNNNVEIIVKLEETYKNAFWTVFELHLQKTDNQMDLINYTNTIYHSLLENKKSFVFAKHVKGNINRWEKLPFPSSENSEIYKSLFLFVQKTKGPIEVLCNLFSTAFIEAINKDENAMEDEVGSFMEIIHVLNDKNLIEIKEDAFNYEKWIKLIVEINKYDYDLTQNIKLPNNLIDEVETRIAAGQEIPTEFPLLIQKLKNNNIKDWVGIVTSLDSHIDWQSGNLQPIFHVRVFEIINELININEITNSGLKQIVKKGQFWNLTNSLIPKDSIKIVAAIFARLFSSDFDNVSIPAIGQSQQAINKVKQFWKTSDTVNAEYIWQNIKKFSDYEFIWEFQNISDKLLIADIIELAINDEKKEFFNQADSFSNFKNAIELCDEEKTEVLAQRFIADSKIERELIDEDFELIPNSGEIYTLLTKSNNSELKDKVYNLIVHLTESEWKEQFDDDSYVLSLLEELFKQKYKFEFNKTYHDAYLTSVESWIVGEKEPDDWQEKRLPFFYEVMHVDFQEHFSEKLSHFLINNNFEINSKIKEFVFANINKKTLFQNEKNSILEFIEENLKEEDHNGLINITNLLKLDDKKLFKPNKRYTRVFKESIQNIYSITENEEQIEAIKYLANIFNIKLEKENEDNGKDENEEETE